MDVAGFRESFPAFDADTFPDVRVSFWLAVGAKRFPAAKWEDLHDQALCLFAAHNLTLERAAALDPSGAGGMSAAAGPAASESKSVGGVSKSKGFNPGATMWQNGGSWNATIYGQQLYDLMRLVGAGGVQL